MKIAILGSAPSSVGLAPFGDPEWEIWACSPGAYAVLGRIDEFFEVHRWEPGVVGKPGTQKPWFSPEYVQWLKSVPPRVWVGNAEALRDIGHPRARMLPWRELVAKYGHYVWTSTVAYMLAMAINKITEIRATNSLRKPGERDVIGFWGVDMAANEELYSNQRSAAQTFIQIAVGLDIDIVIPPESDLATPPPMYGISESFHKSIKLLSRKNELEQRAVAFAQQAVHARETEAFLRGALDDMSYHLTMWNFDEDVDTVGMRFDDLFKGPGKLVAADAVVEASPDPVEILVAKGVKRWEAVKLVAKSKAVKAKLARDLAKKAKRKPRPAPRKKAKAKVRRKR